MDVIFLGNLFPENRINEIRKNSLSKVDNAANNLQYALLDGLIEYYSNINIISLPVIGSYPINYKKIYFKKSFSKYNDKFNLLCVNFINLILIKHYSRYVNSLRALKKIVKPNKETLIFLYSINSPFLKAINEFKKDHPNVQLCLIAPDLPQFMSESKNPIYKILKTLDIKIIHKYLPSIDYFVVLSDFMYSPLKIGIRPWTRIEGIFSSKTISNINSQEINAKTILYTGTLDYRLGIMNLLKAFMEINDEEFKLWICGAGNASFDIINASKNDHRIIFFGILPLDEILELQKKATVLVNPRSSEGEFTKYSFPSKTLEYMASGTPCIMHRLPSVPKEYNDFIFFTDRDDYTGLKEKIIEVCSMKQTDLNDFGQKASQFIFENKNPKVQVKKIYDMINQYKK